MKKEVPINKVVKVNKFKLIMIIVGLLIGTFIAIILLTPRVSSFEFDNVKSYDTLTRIATIKNAFGFGDTITTAQLNSPDWVVVGLGEQNIANVTINSLTDYNNLLSNVDQYNLKTGKKITRAYTFKKWVVEEVDINEYVNVISQNKTSFENVIAGTHKELRGKWEDVSKDFKKGDSFTIGIFTETKEGDSIEWIPTIAGVRINEWAFYNATIDVGIVAHYPTNETTGTNLVDYLGFNDNGTVVNTPTWNPTSITYNGNSKQYTNLTNLEVSLNGTNAMTFAVNFSFTDTTNTKVILEDEQSAGGYNQYELLLEGGAIKIYSQNSGTRGICDIGAPLDITGTMPTATGVNYAFVGVINTTGWYIWLNNGTTTRTQNKSCSATGLFFSGSYYPTIAGRGGGSFQWLNGTVGVNTYWNRSLNNAEALEVLNVLVNGSNNAPTIILNSPVDVYNSSSQTITFNGTATKSTNNIANVSLIINATYNTTNTSGIEGTYTFSETISDGIHNWTMEVCDIINLCTNATTRTFFIDTTLPTTQITSPIDATTYTYQTYGDTFNLNVTATDTNLDKCFYEYNNSNTTYSCSSGVQQNETFSITNQSDIRVWANDTSGNLNSSSVSWTYDLFDFNNYTYDATITESSSTTFYGQFQTSSSVSTAYLQYNNTNYSTSINSLGGNQYITYTTVTSPLVSTDTNISWNFWINDINATSYNQTVSNINLDSCSPNTIQIMNLTLYDEALQTSLNASTDNTSIKLDLSLYANNTSTIPISQFSKFYNKTLPARVCVNSTITTSLIMNSQIEYSDDGYADEFYNILGYNLNTTSNPNENITLYDLNSSDSQAFKLLVRDSSYLPLQNALIEVYRRYIDEGTYQIVEIPKTDAKGESIAHLVVNDVIYRFVIKKDGVNVSVFDSVRATCQNPSITSCSIDFNAFASGITVPDYYANQDFNFTLGYNSTSRTISSVFTIPSATSSTVILNVTKEDVLGTSVCTDTSISSSGTLSCIVPSTIGNSTVIAKLYKDGVLQSQGQIKLDENPSDIYGGVLVFLGLFIMLTLIGASLSDNPIFTVIFFMLGVIILFALNLVANNGFIGSTATILWLILAIIIVLIKGGRRT